ncbi:MULTISPECIES: phage integrase N-terminal SAM-like domain-containing protein [unclassified Nostoc]|uniref:phage integrase N-terminal SAM-like domain-containing protein n=1 Tax=unclassified Nostoc TaxID=2593658 RepID=UPI003458A280
MRLKHYSYKREKSYIDWIRRYIFFHDKRHPKDMGSAEIEAFLTHLAVKKTSLRQLKIHHECKI